MLNPSNTRATRNKDKNKGMTHNDLTNMEVINCAGKEQKDRGDEI